eukprot:7405373-Heterocapsa_arctica.AAC.2
MNLLPWSQAVAPDLVAVVEEDRVGYQEAEDLGVRLDGDAMSGQDVLAQSPCQSGHGLGKALCSPERRTALVRALLQDRER